MSWDRMRNLFEQMPVDVLREAEGQFRRFVNERLRDAKWYESGWLPELDLRESDAAYTLEMDLPGVVAESLVLEVTGNVVTVRGERAVPQCEPGGAYRYRERRFGRFERSFPVAANLQEDAASAKIENGVLIVTLPKAASARVHTVHVNIAQPE